MSDRGSGTDDLGHSRVDQSLGPEASKGKEPETTVSAADLRYNL